MAKYKARERCYDGITIREEGEIFDYEGKTYDWMEPVKEKKGAKAKDESPELEPVKEK